MKGLCTLPQEGGIAVDSNERFRGNQYRATQVCVDSYHDGVLVGRLYNQANDEPRPFRSTIQFLLQMEDLLDQLHFPQSFQAVRTFGEPLQKPSGELFESAAQPSGEQATFELKVFFRQNASWQGSVTWKEGGLDQNFRSVLELLLLLDDALKRALSQK